LVWLSEFGILKSQWIKELCYSIASVIFEIINLSSLLLLLYY